MARDVQRGRAIKDIWGQMSVYLQKEHKGLKFLESLDIQLEAGEMNLSHERKVALLDLEIGKELAELTNLHAIQTQKFSIHQRKTAVVLAHSHAMDGLIRRIDTAIIRIRDHEKSHFASFADALMSEGVKAESAETERVRLSGEYTQEWNILMNEIEALSKALGMVISEAQVSEREEMEIATILADETKIAGNIYAKVQNITGRVTAEIAQIKSIISQMDSLHKGKLAELKSRLESDDMIAKRLLARRA